MSIIRKTIRINSNLFTGTTSGGTINNFVDIKIPLGSMNGFTGFQQEIDNLTQFTSTDLVNPVTDEETRKYGISSINPVVSIAFQFYLGSWYNSFMYNGFTYEEVGKNYLNFLNSFFILDLFDTYDVNTQTKLFTTYLTKKGNSVISLYSITGSSNQFYNWYIPVSYIEAQTGTTSTGYTRFMFYNAKYGKTTVFYNSDNAALKTAERMFFKVVFNHTSRTWRFVTTSYPSIIAKEMISSPEYVNKVNDTVDTINNLQQQPPSGNTFSYSGNTAYYLIT